MSGSAASRFTSHSSVRVRYAETDQMGVAYHGGYFAWLEVGRTDLLRAHGFTYREMEQQGVRLPVIEVHARYLRPALYDDVLDIHTELAEAGGARLGFRYAIRREGEEAPLALAETAHAAVSRSGRPCRLPEALRRLFS